VKPSARVVVIGGGVGGCSILYWLARLGWDDVVLVERADLTSGSTFHSAGLVGQLRGSLSLTKMMMGSVELYRTVGEEVGLETGWHEVGSLRLAGGKPLAVERSSLPSRLFSDIEDMDLSGSLYDVMGEGFGLRPVSAVERLELVEARPSDARSLGVRRDAPLLLVERIGYAADGTPVEFARDRFRADRTRLEIESALIPE